MSDRVIDQRVIDPITSEQRTADEVKEEILSDMPLARFHGCIPPVESVVDAVARFSLPRSLVFPGNEDILPSTRAPHPRPDPWSEGILPSTRAERPRPSSPYAGGLGMPAKSRFGAHPPHLLCNFGFVLLLVCTGRAAHGAENDAVIPKAAETYAGVFAAAARPGNRIVDQDGFANWGNSGGSVDYGRRGFVAGALAVSRIANSVVDIDFGPDMPTREDPDDSFRDRSTEVGWVIGAGIEVPLPDSWALRVEGSHLDFGRETHRVNHSGGGRCGPGGVRKPCPYTVENKLRILRLGITRRFGR